MIAGIRLKICGLTSLVDAGLADAAGADHLGFVLHPESPRSVTLDQFRVMAPRLPARPKVAVVVEPAAAELAAAAGAGFDFFQVHFRLETPAEQVAAWAGAVGRARLWLAPRLPPAVDVPAALLAAADTFLLDTFDAKKSGGTGRTGDWAKFRRHRETQPEKHWVLAGGLTPENVAAALAATGARWLDVSSGVERAPGVKDSAKITALVAALRGSAGARK
ncbi:MAG TPA: phosphoribosylanthranilate isomerase [Opitutaceae bacterium]|nr:phosphoribosylanthranilate isomerase [Opitutaceae bacterium]